MFKVNTMQSEAKSSWIRDGGVVVQHW